MKREPHSRQRPGPENDFFISHASEDKETWAKPLRQELEDLGCKVWLDDGSIPLGTDLVRELNEGLRNSKYMIAIVSPHSLDSKWCEAEWDAGIWTAIETAHDFRIFPVRHQVTAEEFREKNPLLGGKYSWDTRRSVRKIAAELVKAISPPELRNLARTTRELKDLQPREFDPNDPEPREYLATMARRAAQAAPPSSQTGAEPIVVASEPVKSHPVRARITNLFICLFAAAIVAASLTAWLNPRVRLQKTRISELETLSNKSLISLAEVRKSEIKLHGQFTKLTGEYNAQKAIATAANSKYNQSQTEKKALERDLSGRQGQINGLERAKAVLDKTLHESYAAKLATTVEANARAENLQKQYDQAQADLTKERAEQKELRSQIAVQEQKQANHEAELAGERSVNGNLMDKVAALQALLDAQAGRRLYGEAAR